MWTYRGEPTAVDGGVGITREPEVYPSATVRPASDDFSSQVPVFQDQKEHAVPLQAHSVCQN